MRSDRPDLCERLSVQPLTYEEFGRRFVEAAVTPARVAEAVQGIAGDAVTIGPLPAGPGDVAVVNAVGEVGTVTADRVPGDDLSYAVVIPLVLSLDVAVGGRHHRYTARLSVPMRMTVRPAEPLRLVIDVVPPRAREVTVDVEARGLQAKALGRAGNIDAQICIQAAAYVRDQLADPTAADAMVVDLGPLVELAWPSPST